MLNNYHYFIALAEEQNISRAAEKLYISHQCLSKYLKNLEQEYRVAFFDRTPHLRLTTAGQAMLDTLRQVQFLEQNLDNRLDGIRSSKRGILRLGTTEGRYRILIPDLLAQYKQMYPDVVLDVQSAVSRQLTERMLKNELDMVLFNQIDVEDNRFEVQPLLEEQLFMVISDEMLAEYFPDRYPQCKAEFAQGVDLAQMQHVPFILSRKNFHSRKALEAHLRERDLQLNCIMELTQLDMHFMMSARAYAASFCWSMYIPTIRQINQSGAHSALNVFPVAGLDVVNQVVLVTLKGKIVPAYGRDLIRLIRRDCGAFASPELDRI